MDFVFDISETDDECDLKELKKDMEVQTCSYLFEEFLWKRFNNTSPGVRLCSLCMEPFDLDTDHRIASLKCGHFFGESCIRSSFELFKKRKPADDEERGGQKCPHCNQPARKTDIRTIYSRIVVALDKTEEQLVQEEAAIENSLLDQLKSEKNTAITNLKFFQEQIKGLKIVQKELESKRSKLKAKKAALARRM